MLSRHLKEIRHDSDDSSVPANLDPFEIKPPGFNVILCVFVVFDLMCLEIPNTFIIIISGTGITEFLRKS